MICSEILGKAFKCGENEKMKGEQIMVWAIFQTGLRLQYIAYGLKMYDLYILTYGVIPWCLS